MDINQNLNNLMKEAQKMQQRMQEAQQQLVELSVVGESGGGMVKVTMKGNHDVTSVKLSASLMNEDCEMLEDLLAAAFNDAVRKVEKVSKDKINKLTAGLNIPAEFLKEEDKDE